MAKFRQPPQSAAEATIVSKTIAANGTYYASSDNADGFDPVVVEVPGEHATIVSKNITANGTYNASSDSADGYNPVTVAVPAKVIVSKNITANGTYNASQDSADGFDPVVVAVPAPVIKSKSITVNGTYNASSDNADGFDPVVVAVPGPVLGTKSISANGTYTAAADGYDGFSSVTVAVSGGAQATITVSYGSYFYNKTMTCSDGITTYTETTTSAGSTVFSVNAQGTWTISCNGVSKTVNVILEYTTQMAITKSVTVYSAASDTVTFTDATGSKTVTTDTSGQGIVNITFIPNESIIFVSSVAKNPDDLSSDYSKSVTMDENITEVYIMPNNTLYWWGYGTTNLEEMSTTNGWIQWGSSNTYESPTFNTNNIDLKPSASDKVRGVASKIKISIDKLYGIATTGGASTYGRISTIGQKTSWSGQIDVTFANTGISKYTLNDTDPADRYAFSINLINTSLAVNLNALWYE